MLIEIVLDGLHELGRDKDGPLYGVVLRERDGRRKCIMMFDEDSVRFIRAAFMHKHVEGVPIAHGAVLDLLAIAGLQLHHVIIPRLEGDHYQMFLHFQLGSRDIRHRMMPGDALAMAAHADCPILMDDALLDFANGIAVQTLARLAAARQESPDAATEAALTATRDKLPQA